MKSLIKIALVSVASMSTVALANHHENCEVKGKKVHVKNEAACTKKKGTWMAPAAEAKPAEAAPAEGAAAPAAEHKEEAPKK
jgi:hypothetical protein